MAGTVYANNPFQINLVASDPDNFPGTPLTYFWTQVAGPATATFSDIYSARPTITCPLAGAYTFQVSVSDSITPTLASIDVTVQGFYTGVQSYTATCPPGKIGSPVTATGTYTSIISQADADAKALAAASTAAGAGLVCTSTPAIWSLKVVAATALDPTESLVYRLFRLDSGTASNPQHATLLAAYPLDGNPYAPGDTIDYTNVVTAWATEETFLWQAAYSASVPAASGSGSVPYSRLLPVNATVLQVDPSYTPIATAYTKEAPVAAPGSGYPVSIVTGEPVLDSTTTYVDAYNPQATYLALQDNFAAPARNRLWIYNWDGRVGINGGAPPGSITPYDYLKVSWLSAGTLDAPITETTLYEQPFSSAVYGANLYDDALNYLSLDAAIAAFPPNATGNLIVRRGIFDPIGGDIIYGPDSVLLRTSGALSGTGSITINSLSGNAAIPEAIDGVATYTPRALGDIFISAGAFALRAYNWRAFANSTYNALLVYQLIGSAGAFTGIAAQYAFPAPSPDSPTGFYEIPLPDNANGISFVVYAGIQTGVNQYTPVGDSFPIGTTYGTNWVDALDLSSTVPFSVTDLSANAVVGLPSATQSVFTILDNTRQVILERNAPYG